MKHPLRQTISILAVLYAIILLQQAAELARRYDPGAKAYYDRKRRRTNEPVAYNALANKLSRAAYYIMRDGVLFMPERMFA
jgi:hypothetical protein